MTDMTMQTGVHPVDEKIPLPKLAPLALQHVLVMYAGAVAVPLIIGRALKLPPEQVAFLISADLFACGLATIVQSLGFPGVGIRLPVMMGVTFASVGPMLAMANSPDIGLLGIYGSVISAGVFGILVAPFMSAAAAAVSAGRHRHDHPRDRHLADARRHQLGRRRHPLDAAIWRARRPCHRVVCAVGHSGADQMGPRLHCQCRRAARHCRRFGGRGAARHDELRQGRNGAMVRRGACRFTSACRSFTSCRS